MLNILKTGKGFSREDMVNLITLNENKEAKEGKPIRSSYYESWRNKAWSVYESILDRAMDKRHKLLVEYYDMVANNYHEHIIKLIEDKTKEKDRTTAQLSDDEQKLQYDNDWLMELKDILTEIERG